MADWSDIVAEAPDLAASAEGRFRATKHHVLATLRRDGAPRVSGTEVEFRPGGLYLGSMGQALKARDLQRDGRFALHANPGDGSMKDGDAKLAGVAVEVTDHGGEPGSHLFRLDVREVVVTSLHPAGDRLLIESWHEGAGVRRDERY